MFDRLTWLVNSQNNWRKYEVGDQIRRQPGEEQNLCIPKRVE